MLQSLRAAGRYACKREAFCSSYLWDPLQQQQSRQQLFQLLLLLLYLLLLLPEVYVHLTHTGVVQRCRCLS